MVYVYYNDGTPVDGDVGLVEFPGPAEAEAFIESRIKAVVAKGFNGDINNYVVITGQKLTIEAVTQVTKINLF